MARSTTRPPTFVGPTNPHGAASPVGICSACSPARCTWERVTFLPDDSFMSRYTAGASASASAFTAVAGVDPWVFDDDQLENLAADAATTARPSTRTSSLRLTECLPLGFAPCAAGRASH